MAFGERPYCDKGSPADVCFSSILVFDLFGLHFSNFICGSGISVEVEV